MAKREVEVADVAVWGRLESVGYGTDQETAYARLQGLAGEITITVPADVESPRLVAGSNYTFEITLRTAAKGAYYLRAVTVREGLPDDIVMRDGVQAAAL